MFGKKKKKKEGPEDAKEENDVKHKKGADKEGRDEPPVKRRINWKFIIIVILAVALALAAGIGMTLWIASKWVPGKEEATEQVEGTDDAANAEAEEEVVEEKPKKPALYYKLRPVFTVGIRDAEGTPRYLQIDLAVMSRDEEVIDLVETHRSLLRDYLLTLFSRVIYEDLYSVEGKDELLTKALQTIREVLEKQTGRREVESVYFTSFVLQ